MGHSVLFEVLFWAAVVSQIVNFVALGIGSALLVQRWIDALRNRRKKGRASGQRNCGCSRNV